MILKETAELYMSIQAPDSLKQKILEKASTPQAKPWRPWKSVLTAACLILIIASTATFLQRPAAELLLYDTIVGKSPVAVAAPIAMATRTASENASQMEIPLEIRDEAEISVSCGEVQWAEDNGNASKSFIWVVPMDVTTDTGATLTVTIKEKKTSYSLFTDETGTRYLVKAE